MFITTTRALALVVIGTVALTAHAERGSTNTVFVETQGGGAAEVYTFVEGDAGSQVDIVATINGETVIDIHEESVGEPIAVHEVYPTNSADGAATHVRSRITATTPALSAPTPPLPPPLLVPQDLPQGNETVYPPLRGSEEEQPHTITNITHITDEAIEPVAYVPGEEPHDDPLVTRIMHSIAHTLNYVFALFF